MQQPLKDPRSRPDGFPSRLLRSDRVRRTAVGFLGLLGVCLFGCSSVPSQPDRIIKVLPQYLDLDGRHAVSASLFERDAYQAWLRENPEEVSGIRYMVQWRARKPGDYRLRLELQGDFEGNRPKRLTLEKPVSIGRFTARWSAVELRGESYETFGPIVSWRLTLWLDDTQLDEEHSFLWN